MSGSLIGFVLPNISPPAHLVCLPKSFTSHSFCSKAFPPADRVRSAKTSPLISAPVGSLVLFCPEGRELAQPFVQHTLERRSMRPRTTWQFAQARLAHSSIAAGAPMSPIGSPLDSIVRGFMRPNRHLIHDRLTSRDRQNAAHHLRSIVFPDLPVASLKQRLDLIFETAPADDVPPSYL
jgi:hypothetical protein